LICAIHLTPCSSTMRRTGPASKALVRPACGPSPMDRSSQWRPQVAGKTQSRRAAPFLDDNLRQVGIVDGDAALLFQLLDEGIHGFRAKVADQALLDLRFDFRQRAVDSGPLL